MIQSNKHNAKYEDDIVVGTTNKYQSINPIVQYLVHNFKLSMADIVSRLSIESILEVGCGEGCITQVLVDSSQARIIATDISDTVLDAARKNVNSNRVTFQKLSIYDLDQLTNSFDLVVCCEVLEHLVDPLRGLQMLSTLSSRLCVMSVPREPIFRLMNFFRGAYFRDIGNSPGHIQHWSKNSFLEFVQNEFRVMAVKSPFPWTLVLGCSVRHRK